MSFLKSLFQSEPPEPTRTIHCPFCQTMQVLPAIRSKHPDGKPQFKSLQGHRCSQSTCARPLPEEFLERYDEAPSLFVPMMGWTGAGKSTFLMMATAMLDRAVHIWEDFNFIPLTKETSDAVREARDAIEHRRLPRPTPLEVKDTYLCHLLGIPRWGSRSWVVRDVPGEHFQQFIIPPEQSSFVAKSRMALLFLDLAGHLEEAGKVAEGRAAGMTINELLQAYVNSLRAQGQSFDQDQGRKVIVVLTKANHLPDLPDHLRSYLEGDELQQLLLTNGNRQRLGDMEMARYMERLDRISTEIREWLRTQSGGEALLRYAKLNHIELRFCMIASIPSGVDSNLIPLGQLEPHRILDPIFWALELNRGPIP
jgi:hypothetical protein